VLAGIHAGVHELTLAAARGDQRWRSAQVVDLPGTR
jgi:hypothetical protein